MKINPGKTNVGLFPIRPALTRFLPKKAVSDSTILLANDGRASVHESGIFVVRYLIQQRLIFSSTHRNLPLLLAFIRVEYLIIISPTCLLAGSIPRSMSQTATGQHRINLYLEANPNPNSLKFVVNLMLVPEGDSYDFPDMASASDAPLAQELFGFPHVQRVFYAGNFITVTKSDETDWLEIQGPIKEHIQAYLEAGKPLLINDAWEKGNAIDENDSEEVKKIKGILDEYIRPAVEQDGGAISFHSFEDGVVKVLLQGSCSGCPSSTVTLKAGIENLLRTMMPEVKEVEAEGV